MNLEQESGGVVHEQRHGSSQGPAVPTSSVFPPYQQQPHVARDSYAPGTLSASNPHQESQAALGRDDSYVPSYELPPAGAHNASFDSFNRPPMPQQPSPIAEDWPDPGNMPVSGQQDSGPYFGVLPAQEDPYQDLIDWHRQTHSNTSIGGNDHEFIAPGQPPIPELPDAGELQQQAETSTQERQHSLQQM